MEPFRVAGLKYQIPIAVTDKKMDKKTRWSAQFGLMLAENNGPFSSRLSVAECRGNWKEVSKQDTRRVRLMDGLFEPCANRYIFFK